MPHDIAKGDIAKGFATEYVIDTIYKKKYTKYSSIS